MRSLKHTFYAILSTRQLTDYLLSTTFCFFEKSIIARPLLRASADAKELDVLTPNLFLLGIAGSSFPSLAKCDFDQRQRYARAHTRSDAIWSWLLKKSTYRRRTIGLIDLQQPIEISKLAILLDLRSQLVRYVTIFMVA